MQTTCGAFAVGSAVIATTPEAFTLTVWPSLQRKIAWPEAWLVSTAHKRLCTKKRQRPADMPARSAGCGHLWFTRAASDGLAKKADVSPRCIWGYGGWSSAPHWCGGRRTAAARLRRHFVPLPPIVCGTRCGNQSAFSPLQLEIQFRLTPSCPPRHLLGGALICILPRRGFALVSAECLERRGRNGPQRPRTTTQQHGCGSCRAEGTFIRLYMS